MVLTPAGGSRGSGVSQRPDAGALDGVHAMAVDGHGDLYLGDIQGRRGQKFRRLGPAVEESDRGLVKRKLPKSDPPVTRTGKSP